LRAFEVGHWGWTGTEGRAIGATGLTGAGAGGIVCGGGGGGVLQPVSHTATTHVMLAKMEDLKSWAMEGIIVQRPSKQHVPFCHCTVWLRSIELKVNASALVFRIEIEVGAEAVYLDHGTTSPRFGTSWCGHCHGCFCR